MLNKLLADVTERADEMHGSLVDSVQRQISEKDCSYKKFQIQYLDHKTNLRLLMIREEYTFIPSERIEILKSLVISLRKKRYENVCGECEMCSTRKKSWNIGFK